MITLPKNLTATRYNGYFWDVKEEKLYSIKVDGILKPLKKYEVNFFFKYAYAMHEKYYYQISVNGKKSYYLESHLKTLKLIDSKIPKFTTKD